MDAHGIMFKRRDMLQKKMGQERMSQSKRRANHKYNSRSQFRNSTLNYTTMKLLQNPCEI